MTISRYAWLLVVAGFASSGVLDAHHAVSEVYDQSTTLTMEGQIVALVYRNPHSMLHVEVADRGGAPHTWAVEWRAARRLLRGAAAGFQPGDRVVMCGNPGRDPGQYRLLLLDLSRPADGETSVAAACGA